MILLELFSGKESISKVARENGIETITLDNNKKFNSDISVDFLEWDYKNSNIKPDFIWASPPCTCFSVASIKHNWKKENGIFIPQSEKTKTAIKIVKKLLEVIKYFKPKYYFIENPRGILRKMPFMVSILRHTVTYCQYGDTRMKPTDIWTNCLKWTPKPPCKNGMKCHQSAPRGSRTGTQGIKGNMLRSIIPEKLCKEIIRCL